MFLLTPAIFPWDLAIVLMIATGLAIAIACFANIRRRARGFFASLLIGLVGYCSLLAAGIVAYGSFIEPQLIVVDSQTVPFPSDHPLRIVVLSDFHLGPYKGRAFLERVVTRVNSLLPDFVFLTGDYILDDGSGRPFDPTVLSPLSQLQTALGVYAVLGNHDHGIHRSFTGMVAGVDHSEEIAATLSSLGITVLRNGSTLVNLGTQTIAVAGVEDRWSPQAADLDKTFAGLPDSVPIILLSHNPDIILDTLSTRAALIVAGHTHGGQIRLPFYGPIPILPTRLGTKFDQGLFPIDTNTVLAITRGIGESGPRSRFFAPPEILLLTTSLSD